MHATAKTPLFPLIQSIPLLVILICLVLLPFYLINRHSSTMISSEFRFRSPQIIFPITTNQNLRYLSLPNGINVLLVSDSDSAHSGCALSVNAGSYDEPNEVSGLAHFLEHMLFEGTEKYPSNDYFDDFLSRNDGGTNAFTGNEETTFYFDVENKAFNEGLEIFSHFFIDARLDPSAVEREIYAVNNEYQIDLQKNNWRFHELLHKLANKGHPFHRFNIGNYKTLKTIPESLNLSISDELKKFYNKHYSSKKMTICVISNQNLDELESLITLKFSSVPRRSAIDIKIKESNQTIQEKTEKVWSFLSLNFKQSSANSKNEHSTNEILQKTNEIFTNKNKKIWNFLNINQRKEEELLKFKQPDSKKTYAFTSENLGKFAWYKTLGNSQELNIVFIVNYTMNEDPFTRSWDYLTDLISNDYVDGFKNYLYRLGWINNLYAGYEPGSKDFIMYMLRFDLTNDGFNSIVDIIHNVFGLIGYITNKGIDQTIYNEKSLISYINFLYQSKPELSDELIDLLGKIGIDLQNVYVNGQVYMKFNEKMIKYWVSQLQPSNALFVIGSNDFQVGEKIEKFAFKKKQPYFKQAKNLTLENEWEIYDDFIQEMDHNENSYRLKNNDKHEKKEVITNNSEKLEMNEMKFVNIFKEKLMERKKLNGFLNFKEKHLLCKNMNKKRGELSEKQTNQTFSSWIYSKKLNKLEENMKIYFRIEPLDQNQLSQFSADITNYASIIPSNLTLYQTNKYIPNDLSIIDNECVVTREINKALAYQQRLLVVTYFTDPINNLISNHLKTSADPNNSSINYSCFETELVKDRESKNPELLYKNNSQEIWLKSSREFGLPQVLINLELFYPNCGVESFMLDLLGQKVKAMLDYELINAKILGYNIDISREATGLIVTFHGFHDKIEDLMRLFLDKMMNATIDEAELNAIKMIALLQDMMNIDDTSDLGAEGGEAIEQAEIIFRKAIQGSEVIDYLKYIKNIDYSTLLNDIDTFKQKTKVKALFFGNILQKDVEKLMEIVGRGFSFVDDNKALNLSCIYNNNQSMIKFPNDISLVFRARNTNPDDSNHAIANYYQYGISEPSALLKMSAFSKTFNWQAFDYLRGQNQLGYVVFSQPIIYNGVLGLGVFIQGSKKNPLEMDGIIEDFLKVFENYLSKMEEKEINQGFVNLNYEIFEKNNKDFSEKANAYWKEIADGNYNFEKKNYKEILKILTKADILEFYSNLLKKEQRKFSIQVWGTNVNVGDDWNVTLNKERNYAGNSQKLITRLDNLEQFIINDNKLKFYNQSS